VLGQEPDLHFIGAQHVAYQHVVGAEVAQAVDSRSVAARGQDDDGVRFQQPGQLRERPFASAWRPRDHGRLRHIRRHCNTHSAKQLDALRDGVDQRDLLLVMLVVKQMQLEKGGPRNLPMGFLYMSRSVMVSARI